MRWHRLRECNICEFKLLIIGGGGKQRKRNSDANIKLRIGTSCPNLRPSHNLLFTPVKILLTVPRRCFFCGSFLFYALCFVSVVYVVLSCLYCSPVITCWEKVDRWALLCLMFSCVLSLSHVVSSARCGTWLYRLLIFAFFLTLHSICAQQRMWAGSKSTKCQALVHTLTLIES